MFLKETTLLVSVLLWTQTLAEGLAPVEWDLHTFPGPCEEKYNDPDLTSVLTSLSKILSNHSQSSSLPKSCIEIKNSSPESPSGYYTLFNASSGVAFITYCDMDGRLFCAFSLTSALEQLQFNLVTIKGEKGDTGMTGPPGPSSGGVVYTRWGRTSCPNTTGTQLLYQGRAGRAWYNDGGGGNYQCMPNDPEYSSYIPGVQDQSYVYGVEYQNPISGSLHDDNVPCAVCHTSTREAVIMIPAKLTCPTDWTREYTGYLMSEHRYQTISTFECVDGVDGSGEAIPGLQTNTDGGTFYHVEANCNGMDCSTYDAEKELTCVVCTR